MSRGGTLAPIPDIFHDQTTVQPVITAIVPAVASTAGGQQVTLRGLAFNQNAATVNVGSLAGVILDSGVDLEGAYIKFTAPKGLDGPQEVIVTTEEGRASNPVIITYEDVDEFAPVKFTNVEYGIPGAGTAAVYCFGYLFVAIGNEGRKGGGYSVYQYELGPGPDYVPTVVQQLSGSKNGLEQNGMTLDTILGLECDPWGSDDDFAVFVSYSHIYPNGGLGDTGSPIGYPGAVVYFLSRENFAEMHLAVENLSVSDHDHAVNGMVFTNTGELLILAGGDTNAGIPNPKLGNLEDGPLSGVVV